VNGCAKDDDPRYNSPMKVMKSGDLYTVYFISIIHSVGMNLLDYVNGQRAQRDG
jgi:hypothetical protein